MGLCQLLCQPTIYSISGEALKTTPDVLVQEQLVSRNLLVNDSWPLL